MTSVEIRSAQNESDNGAWESARWLQEVAYQLAVFNENIIKAIKGEFDKDETPKL